MSNFSKFLILLKKDFTFLLRDKKTILNVIISSVILAPLLFVGIEVMYDFQDQNLEGQTITVGIEKKAENSEFVNILRDKSNIEIKTVSNSTESLENNEITGYLEIESVENNAIESITYVYDETSNISNFSTSKIEEFAGEYTAGKRAERLVDFNVSETDLNPVIFNINTIQAIKDVKSTNPVTLFLLPYLLLLGMVAGVLQFAVEITAGEKERRTLATTLSLNAPLSSVVFAKIGAISLFSLIISVLNILSLFISFQLLKNDQFGSLDLTLEGGLFLIMILIPLSVLTSSALVALGVLARNEKEGNVYITPLLLFFMFASFTSLLFDKSTPVAVYAIPVIGHVAGIKQILLQNYSLGSLLILSVSTLLFTLVVGAVTTYLYSREEVLFRL